MVKIGAFLTEIHDNKDEIGEMKNLHKKKNSDITVIRVSDSFKWVMFMQNFEHGVTVFNQ